MAVGMEISELAKKELNFSPKEVREHRVEADTVELRLRVPATYAPYKVEVSLGTKNNLRGITVSERREVWEGEINLGRVTEEEAKTRYLEILNKVTKGEYIAHKFDSGKLEIELLE